LWMSMIDRIRLQYGISMIFFDQLSELSKIDKLYTHRYLTALADEPLRKEDGDVRF